MSKGGYLLPWNNVYEKYIAFSKARDQNHPCHTLTNAINGEKGNLERDLGYLDKYYAEIRDFLNLVANAKKTPSTRVHDALKAKEAKLCSWEDTLSPYYWGYIGGLRALASIAKDIDPYIAALKQWTSSTGAPRGIEVVTALLTEVGSISKKVKEDWENEVGSGPGAFDAYVSKRPQKLLELRTTGSGTTG
jgi:hypothetical protein